MGPNRKQMPNGTVQAFYDGIQVRKVPLPLRVPQNQLPPQQQQQVVGQQQQQQQANKAPGSPILTHLLHRKADSPKVDAKVRGIFS